MAKRREREWPGELGKPIIRKLELPTFSPEGNEYISMEGWSEMVAKMPALAEHYGVKPEGDPDWGFLLALEMAKEFVPGFQRVFNDPFAAAIGLPTIGTGGRKDGRAGTGFLPEFSGERLLLMVETAINLGLATSELEACRLIMKSIAEANIEPPHAGREKRNLTRDELAAVERSAKTLVGRLTKARAAIGKNRPRGRKPSASNSH